MKSAYELAISRLEKNSPAAKLTAEQKELLRGIDDEFDARIAERRIFLESEIIRSGGDPVVVDSLRKQLSAELASIEEKRAMRKEKIRQS
jgi:hypothetical protein